MNDRRVHFWIGIGVLMAGGALLAFGGERTGTLLGTTLGLAGLGLVGWALLRGPGGPQR
jgi:hypothetical protein